MSIEKKRPVSQVLGSVPTVPEGTLGRRSRPDQTSQQKTADTFWATAVNLRCDFRAHGAVERKLSVSQVSGSVSLVSEVS